MSGVVEARPSQDERRALGPSTEELREAVLAGLLAEQMTALQLQRDVQALLGDTDRRLTASVQQIRDLLARLTELIGRGEEAFKGELALRAAELARREFAQATAGVFSRLQDTLTAVAKEAAVSRWKRVADMTVTAVVTSLLTSALVIPATSLLVRH